MARTRKIQVMLDERQYQDLVEMASGLRFILSTDGDFDAFGTVERIDPAHFPR